MIGQFNCIRPRPELVSCFQEQRQFFSSVPFQLLLMETRPVTAPTCVAPLASRAIKIEQSHNVLAKNNLLILNCPNEG